MKAALLGIDGDDTLWHSEIHFEDTQRAIRELLRDFVDVELFDASLLAQERRNLPLYGYGVKGFALSVIETAIDLSKGRVPARLIAKILGHTKDLLSHPVELLAQVESTLEELSARFRLVLITKGDLFHQQAKVAASGLSHHFAAVEIVAEKDPSDYLGVLARHGVAADEFIMVGNSLRSDVLPVLEIGGGAVYIPYEVTWALEVADLGDKVTHRLVQIDSMRQLRGAVDQLIS